MDQMWCDQWYIYNVHNQAAPVWLQFLSIISKPEDSSHFKGSSESFCHIRELAVCGSKSEIPSSSQLANLPAQLLWGLRINSWIHGAFISAWWQNCQYSTHDRWYIYILLYIYFIYTYINRDEIFSILGFQLGSKSDFQCCCRWWHWHSGELLPFSPTQHTSAQTLHRVWKSPTVQDTQASGLATGQRSPSCAPSTQFSGLKLQKSQEGQAEA